MDGANDVKRGHDIARMQKGLLRLSRKIFVSVYIYIYTTYLESVKFSQFWGCLHNSKAQNRALVQVAGIFI